MTQCNSQSLYFLHIPKTAGTSLRYWLADYFSHSEWLPCNILDEVDRIPAEQFNQFRFFAGHFAFKIYDYLQQKPLTITWLREPVAREISHYNFMHDRHDKLARIAQKNGRDGWIQYYEQVRDLTLPEFCQSPGYLGFNDNLQTRYLSGAFPAAGRLECNREMLDRAKANLMELFHFGLCEWMAPSIDLLCLQLACPRRPLNTTLNRNLKRKKHTDELRESALDIVRHVNRFDVELYDFAKQEFARRLVGFWQKVVGREVDNPPAAQEILSNYDRPKFSSRIRDFLNCNFQQQRESSESKVHEASINFRDAAFINGWYPRSEIAPGKFWRWAGPNRESSVFVPLHSDCDYSVSFKVRRFVDFQTIRNLQLRVGNHTIPMKWHHRVSQCGCFQWIQVTGRISRSAIDPNDAFTEIVFVADKTYEQNVDYDKTRFVTFATDRIDFKAA